MPYSSAKSLLVLQRLAWQDNKHSLYNTLLQLMAAAHHGIGSHMTTQKAQVFLDTNRTIAPISPLLFGGFAEHMGRCVYEGIYDPASPHADDKGLRKDVLEALCDQAYTVIRY